MEESSEKRRARLRAMREEASLAGSPHEGAAGNPPDAPGFPVPSYLEQVPVPPSPRFEFYTDPLAAFSGSQRKKSKKSFGSPLDRAALASPSPSLLPQPSFTPPNPPGTSFLDQGASAPNLVPNPNLTPPSSFSPFSHGTHNQAGRPPPVMAKTSDHYNVVRTPYADSNPNSKPNHSHMPHGKFFPGSFSTSSSIGHSNSGSSAYAPRSVPYSYNEAVYTNPPAPHNFKGGRGSYSAESPQRHVGGIRSKYGHDLDGSWSWGNKQSPAGADRGTPVSGSGRGFYRGVSESPTAVSFAKRSMLEDPWKDLVPVRIESVAVRLDSCSGPGRHDWLPKSVSRAPVTKQGVSVSTSGPSLADSLAASFSDAVAEEEGA